MVSVLCLKPFYSKCTKSSKHTQRNILQKYKENYYMQAKPNIRPSGCTTILPASSNTHQFCKWLPWQCPEERPLRDRKTNFRLIKYSYSSINSENLAKIGLIDFEVIGLAGIVKNYENRSRTYSLLSAAGWAKRSSNTRLTR